MYSVAAYRITCYFLQEFTCFLRAVINAERLSRQNIPVSLKCIAGGVRTEQVTINYGDLRPANLALCAASVKGFHRRAQNGRGNIKLLHWIYQAHIPQI
jgi:hypothetical protein